MVKKLVASATVVDISRFPSFRKRVEYSGLGARVYDSGGKYTTGRKDLRGVMVDVAHVAIRHHPFWKKEFARLELRLGRNKAYVAIARKLLVVVWHVLTKEVADRFAVPEKVATALLNHVYQRIGVRNLPPGMTAKEYMRHHLDNLGIGADLTHIPWGSKRVKLPPSRLVEH